MALVEFQGAEIEIPLLVELYGIEIEIPFAQELLAVEVELHIPLKFSLGPMNVGNSGGQGGLVISP
jgi:hypothetical protein